MTAQLMVSPAASIQALIRHESTRAAQERATATAHRLEDVEFMHATGETWERIADRLGMNLPALARWLLRNGHDELGREADAALRRIR